MKLVNQKKFKLPKAVKVYAQELDGVFCWMTHDENKISDQMIEILDTIDEGIYSLTTGYYSKDFDGDINIAYGYLLGKLDSLIGEVWGE